ncbi:MAG: Na+/H+ antiporter subunit E [Phaeodactylibacter sp.]|nr:Na+/H+ antiporter subunit E [Phaeodactylibacter sp.]
MKTNLLMNLLLTFVWAALTGNFDYENFLFGFLLSFGIMWLISRSSGDTRYFTLVLKVLAFIGFFIKELVKANLEVAYDVITPRFHMTPGIVRIPLEANTKLEITFLANLISLTPGTLSLDVSDDQKVLYVHSMYIADKEEFIRSIKDGFEKRLLAILR